MDFLQTISGYQPTIIVGNVLATHNAEMLAGRYPRIFVCLGGGELAMASLVEYLQGKREKKEIPNVAFWDEVEGKVFFSPRELNPVSPPHRFLIDEVIRKKGRVYLEFSRGCPFNCAFCERRYFFGCGRRIEKEVSQVLEEIFLLSRKGQTLIDFVDEDLIGKNPEGARKLAERVCGMKKRGELPESLSLMFSISVRAVYSSDLSLERNAEKHQVLELLKRAGLNRCFIGVESGSPTQLARYGKKHTVAEAKTALRILREIGIVPELGFIMFDPWVTKSELRENLDFLAATGSIGNVSNPFHQLRSQINTSICERMAEKGLLKKESYDPNWLTFEWEYQFPQISEIVRAAKEFESGLIFLEDALKRIYRSDHFEKMNNRTKSFVERHKEGINVLMVEFLECLLEREKEDRKNILDLQNQKLVEFLGSLIREGRSGIFDKLNHQGRKLQSLAEELLESRRERKPIEARYPLPADFPK
jgi:radical SAM superfamily enzyme YgiQ (UPF0313 family)